MSSYNPFSLTGKTILVTGASSGIGQATAIECSKLGAKLVITGRNAERLQETMNQLEGDGHQQIIAELTKKEDVIALADFCPEINGLVLCAGKGMTLPIPFCDSEKFFDVFSLNFFSAVEVVRLLIRKKRISKGGSVVYVASIGGNQRFAPGNSVYGSAKAALAAFMKYSAVEFAGKKIRVNSVNPGMTYTKLIYGGKLTEDDFAADIEQTPLKRFGQPIDIAHGIIYLLSDASSWVTGHELVIDGGRTI